MQRLSEQHSDLREPDGVSPAKQQRGHGLAEVLLPAHGDEARQVHGERTSEIHLARCSQHTTGGCCSHGGRESGEALQSLPLPGGFAALGSALQPEVQARADGFAAGLPKALCLPRDFQRPPGPGRLAAGEPLPSPVPPGQAPRPREPRTPLCLRSRCLHTRI
ncbi:unnamed protein product [Coccothraustes coccothraustes]